MRVAFAIAVSDGPPHCPAYSVPKLGPPSTGRVHQYEGALTGRPTADLQTVLISEETGQMNWPSEKGLYFFDTRVVSNWTIYANSETGSC